MLRQILFVIALALMSTRAMAQGGTIGGGGGGGNAVVTDSLKRLANGTAAAPSLAFLNSAGTGLYRFGADTLGFATGGIHSLRLSGGAAATIAGGAGNMTITAGTGNSRLLVFQSTTSTGTATNSFVVNATQDIAMSNNGSGSNRVLLSTGNSVSAPGLAWSGDDNTGLARLGADTLDIVTAGATRARWATNAATGAGDVAVCITTVNVITKGATCGSSTRKIKTGIATLTPVLASRALALRPVSFTYDKGFYGERRDYGLIAEEVARVDSTFAFYAAETQALANGQVIKKGEPYNVNDRAVLASLLALVQQQQQDIDQLHKVLLGLLGAGGAAGAGLAGWRKRKAT